MPWERCVDAITEHMDLIANPPHGGAMDDRATNDKHGQDAKIPHGAAMDDRATNNKRGHNAKITHGAAMGSPGVGPRERPKYEYS